MPTSKSPEMEAVGSVATEAAAGWNDASRRRVSADAYAAPLRYAFEAARQYLQSLGHGPVSAAVTGEDLRTRLDKHLGATGTPPHKVIEDLVRDAEPGLTRSSSGRFFSGVIGGTLPSALAADWLTSAWDQSGAASARSPAGAMVEQIAGSWLLSLLGLPSTCSFALVTGCQMAHVTCLAAARHRLLARLGVDAERDGLFGTSIRVITSTGCHDSVVRAMRLLGLGSRALRAITTDRDGRIDLQQLVTTLHDCQDHPVILVLQAGDLHRGAFDPFEPAIALARTHPNAWVHVDGAFGLWAAASRQHRHLVAGASLADSWAVDGHKLLNLPFDTGYAVVRDAEAHRAAFALASDYLALDPAVREPVEWTPEWSRRCRGFVTYAALRELGTGGVEDLVDTCVSLTRLLVQGIAEMPYARVIGHPHFNQAIVQFRAADKDLTPQVVDAVNRSGQACFGLSKWNGEAVMRVSLCNWRTTRDDVLTALRALSRAVESIARWEAAGRPQMPQF